VHVSKLGNEEKETGKDPRPSEEGWNKSTHFKLLGICRLDVSQYNLIVVHQPEDQVNHLKEVLTCLK
jgi:hypothetical protein